MINNPVDLAKEMNIDLNAVEVAWKQFHLNRKVMPPFELLEAMKDILEQKEQDFLLYLGLCNISRVVDNSCKGLSNG